MRSFAPPIPGSTHRIDVGKRADFDLQLSTFLAGSEGKRDGPRRRLELPDHRADGGGKIPERRRNTEPERRAEPPLKHMSDVPAAASGAPDPSLARPTNSVISHRNF